MRIEKERNDDAQPVLPLWLLGLILALVALLGAFTGSVWGMEEVRMSPDEQVTWLILTATVIG